MADYEPEDVTISIVTPLPMSVAGELINAVGSRWPGAQIKTDGFGGGGLRFLIPAEEVFSPLPVNEGPPELTDPFMDPEFIGFHGGTLETRFPEWMTGHLYEVGKIMLDDSDATNYLEWSVGNGKDDSIVICLRRKDGKTPHELRQEAENELHLLQRRVVVDGESETATQVAIDVLDSCRLAMEAEGVNPASRSIVYESVMDYITNHYME